MLVILSQKVDSKSSYADELFNGILWGSLYNNHSGLKSIVEEKLAATAPMASAGATFTVVDKSVTSEINGLAPIYALNSVKTTNDVMEYNLSSGEYLYVDNIGLEGLNAQNAAYYGFSPENGHWILVDKDGSQLQGSDVATLTTNSVTGYTKLVAGRTAGTVYLKYLIDEGVYATAERPKVYAKNADLASTAMIEVNVSLDPFADGNISVEGTLTGIVGDPAKAIEGVDGLTVSITDSTGKELSRPVVWDAQELEKKGIKIEDNQISFTQEGTFHIRATTGSVHSAWYEVTALPARKLATIQIPETATLDYKDHQTLDLNTLAVSYKDQYGADWTPVPTLTWACADEGAAIDADNVLTIPSAGIYTVTASAGGVTSNTLTITVTDSRAKMDSFTPATKTLSSSGGSVEFTITGANLTDGITVKADDSITATTTGTATEQKATLTFPANTDIENAKTYTVTNSLDDTKTAVVTVAKKPTGGGSGGGGGGSSVSAYDITVESTKNGSVSSDRKSAEKGSAVTLTPKADTGYTLETLTVLDQNDKEIKLTEKNGKYTFTMPASKVTVKATFMEDNTMLNHFVDVPADAYYYDAVLWAVEEGITTGTSATTFSPDGICTRAQAVTFLWRANGSPAPKSADNPFADVSTDAYYYEAVLWAVEEGITTGTSATTFSPDDTCSRAQIVTFLYRVAGAPAATGVLFSDVAADTYYANAVKWAVANKITSGTSADTFSPDANCTRGQIVTLLFRQLGE